MNCAEKLLLLEFSMIYNLSMYLIASLLTRIGDSLKSLRGHSMYIYSKTYIKQSLSKRPKNGLQDQLLLYACQTYCILLQGVHSAIFSTFI